ncbi:hypothetical protein LINGRAPRIM_LOCUS252 [Linum grandiflorum]
MVLLKSGAEKKRKLNEKGYINFVLNDYCIRDLVWLHSG